VKGVLEKPTAVYDGNETSRYVFVSDEIERNGKPMAVVVENTGSRAEVVTATWKRVEPKSKLWSSSGEVYSHFDPDSDIVYFSVGPALEAYAEEDETDPQIWYRYRFDDDAPCGVTVFDIQGRLLRMDVLFEKISNFLGIAEAQVQERLSMVLSRSQA
jgi:hypothetical protein